MVKQICLRNFTAFNDLEIEFSRGINIISGENSSGKTHLLKAIDALTRIMLYNETRDDDPLHEQRFCIRSIIQRFDPRCNLNDLVKDTSLARSVLELTQFNSDQVTVGIDLNTPQFDIKRRVNSVNQSTVLIPSKDMMFFLPDFLGLMNKYELRTDVTFNNIVSNMVLPWAIDERLSDTTKEIIQDIKNLLGGTFKTSDDLSIVFEENGVIRSAKLVAEGYRKFGVLSRLIESGCIMPGVSGSLLWDEPETNLNPKMMKPMAEILVKLARAGQQLILVTQSYVFMKWFELLLDSDESDQILFHNLCRDEESSEIKVETSKCYGEIETNSIDFAYEAILDTQLKKDMESFTNEKD